MKLHPSPSFKINNSDYLAIRHNPSHLMVSRVIVDLRLRMAGKKISKGFSVEHINGDESDLRFENLRIVTTKEKPRRNGFGAHYANGIRFKALSEGACPNTAVQKKNAMRIRNNKHKIGKDYLVLFVKWKQDDGFSHSQIANRYNKAFSLKGISHLRPKDVKEILKGIPSKQQQNKDQKKTDFESWFNEK